jgi:A/G-specific adenine glycosylase
LQFSLPVIPPKAEKKRSKLAVFVIETPQGIALRKRPKKGVLADMWEFANVDITENEPPMPELLEKFGVKNYTLLGKNTHTHVFTHLIWDMTAYRVFTEDHLDLACYPKEKLKSEISLATAFRWCLQLLE